MLDDKLPEDLSRSYLNHPGYSSRIMYDSLAMDLYIGGFEPIVEDFRKKLGEILRARESAGKPNGKLIVGIDFLIPNEIEDA